MKHKSPIWTTPGITLGDYNGVRFSYRENCFGHTDQRQFIAAFDINKNYAESQAWDQFYDFLDRQEKGGARIDRQSIKHEVMLKGKA